MKTMKMIIGIVTLMLFTTDSMRAQIEAGIKTSILSNSSSISGTVGDILPDTKNHLGYSVGVYADIMMNSSISFHPEILFSTRGFSMNQGTDFNLLGLDIPVGVKAETNMKYVETLALMRFKAGSKSLKGFVEIGPGIGYATSLYIQPKATLLLEFNLPQVDVDLSGDTYNRTDITANIGTGIEYSIGQATIGASLRYSQGLVNVLNSPIINTSIRHQTVSLGVSYGYRF